MAPSRAQRPYEPSMQSVRDADKRVVRASETPQSLYSNCAAYLEFPEMLETARNIITDGRMIPLLWVPPAAFQLYRVPTFLAPLLNVFKDASEQWQQFKKLRTSISHLRSQEVIAAAGGRQHLTGAVHEHWWPKDDARENTLT